MAKPDLVDAVEQAYRPGPDPARWLADVVDVLRPSLDRGGGIFGWFYDARDYRNIQFTHPTLRDVDPGLLPAIGAALADEHTTLDMTRRHYAMPAGPFSHSLGDAFASHVGWRKNVFPTGTRDLVVLNAMDPNRRGCAVLAPRRQVTPATPARLALLSRVAAHLASAQRLVRAGAAANEPEAVLSAAGRVEHASGPARDREHREALTGAAQAMDRARGRMRRLGPEESLRTWRAMVSGRWTLVDQFDSDGKRFLVARVNPPRAPRLARLSERERQVAGWAALGHSNKLIAYELGVSLSTVAGHLDSALRKLRLRRTVDLARVFPDALPEPAEAE
jgi:DNA-binding CsgD family transcriptional regulator